MKIKHKIGFIALITMIDIFVIILVVINSDKTSIQNDVNTKTSAHFLAKSDVQEQVKSEIIDVINEVKEQEVKEENIEENIEEKNEQTSQEEQIEDNKEEIKLEEKQETNNQVVQTIEPVVEENTVSNEISEETQVENREIIQVAFDDLALEEKVEALNNGTLALEYSGLYTNSNERLTRSKGVVYYNGHRETYYSEKVLPGQGLRIPGRHVAEDGTIRDEDGYICVASDLSYLARGSILITSLGPAKVYDTGCAYGTIDIYVNW